MGLMVITLAEAAELGLLVAPQRHDWWHVDWPDGRCTALRSQGDALELAARIAARFAVRVVTIRHTDHLDPTRPLTG
jgi:hypothetical protein